MKTYLKWKTPNNCKSLFKECLEQINKITFVHKKYFNKSNNEKPF